MSDGRLRISGIAAVIVAALLLSGCRTGQDLTLTPDPPDEQAHPTVGAAEDQVDSPNSRIQHGSQVARFEYDGRRYDISCAPVDPGLVESTPLATSHDEALQGAFAIYRIEGVDPSVLVAIQVEGCSYHPAELFRGASAADESSGTQTSKALKRAWCQAALKRDPNADTSC